MDAIMNITSRRWWRASVAEGSSVNPVLMDSYVGALVESLDNLSSFLASDSVVEKYCHALFAHLYLVDVVVAIC
jgi:hypothetical protein